MAPDYLHTANELLSDFKPISLAEMDKVKLMDRVDSKFILPFEKLSCILTRLPSEYYVLTIKDHKVFSYQTDYFDTADLNMYSDHHNGKMNRYKLRQRAYIESDIRFLEVKFKSNKGRVIKDRIQRTYTDHGDFEKFVKEFTPYKPEQLSIVIENRFNRFTLVDCKLQERVTIDFNLMFSDREQHAALNGLVIIEVKQNKNSRQSPVFKALRENRIRPESFSKYCLGVALLNRAGKSNNFKETINLINKLSHAELSA
jgi:hypothetical protein